MCSSPGAGNHPVRSVTCSRWWPWASSLSCSALSVPGADWATRPSVRARRPAVRAPPTGRGAGSASMGMPSDTQREHNGLAFAALCGPHPPCRLFMGAYIRLPVLALNADLPPMSVFDCWLVTCAGVAAYWGMAPPVGHLPPGLPARAPGWPGVALQAARLSAPAAAQSMLGRQARGYYRISDVCRWRAPVTSASPVARVGVGRHPPRAGTRRRGGGGVR